MGIDQNNSICFIIGQLGLGGSEKQLFLLTRELVKQGWQVTVIDINPSNGNNWITPLEHLGIHVFTLFKVKNQARRIVEITKILKSENPEIVHSWSLYTNIYAALCGAFAGIPVKVGSERGNQEYSIRQYGKFKYSINLLGLDGLITNSVIEENLLHKCKPRLYVKVISNGIDEIHFYSKDESRKFLGIRDDSIVIAGLGSFTLNKNFDFLLEVFSILFPRYPSSKIVLIGDGPEREKLVVKASELLPSGSYIFEGNIPEAQKFLKGIDILCVPSLSEGMPNVILEAGLAGIPVVANKVGTIPLIINDGVNGFVIPVGDKVKFASAIEELIKNSGLRDNVAANGQRMIREKYSSQKMANDFLQYYLEMMFNPTLPFPQSR